MLTTLLASTLALATPSDEATESVPTTADLIQAGVPLTARSLPFVDQTQLEARKSPEPAYPEAAKEENLDAILCIAHLEVLPDGSTGGVWVQGCPETFHPATVDALEDWTWKRPAKQIPRGPLRTRVDIDFRVVD